MRRAIVFVRRACEGPRKNQIDAEKINHTQPCFSSALVKDCCGLFYLPMALCTGHCASKKFLLFR
jgi:hypothetical protein